MTYGYSLYDIRLQPLWHTVAASMTYGYSLYDQVSGIPTFVLGATTVLRSGPNPGPDPDPDPDPGPDPDPDPDPDPGPNPDPNPNPNQVLPSALP